MNINEGQTQFLKFLIAGGLAALVNIVSRIGYNELVSFSVAVVLAYLTGMATAFVLNKLFVFEESDNSTQKEMIYFALVNVFAVLQTWGISMLLYSYVLPDFFPSYYAEISHVVGVLVPVFTSYLGHKYFTFKKEER